MLLSIILFVSAITPTSSHQHLHAQRPVTDTSSKRLNTVPKVKPPREVSLRVKFIRLGEVSLSLDRHSTHHILGKYITRKILC